MTERLSTAGNGPITTGMPGKRQRRGLLRFTPGRPPLMRAALS
jgi:hypothetical protein